MCCLGGASGSNDGGDAEISPDISIVVAGGASAEAKDEDAVSDNFDDFVLPSDSTGVVDETLSIAAKDDAEASSVGAGEGADKAVGEGFSFDNSCSRRNVSISAKELERGPTVGASIDANDDLVDDTAPPFTVGASIAANDELPGVPVRGAGRAPGDPNIAAKGELAGVLAGIPGPSIAANEAFPGATAGDASIAANDILPAMPGSAPQKLTT